MRIQYYWQGYKDHPIVLMVITKSTCVLTEINIQYDSLIHIGDKLKNLFFHSHHTELLEQTVHLVEGSTYNEKIHLATSSITSHREKDTGLSLFIGNEINGRILNPEEVYELGPNTELLTLNTCNTFRAEELSRSFLNNGVDTLLTTQ